MAGTYVTVPRPMNVCGQINCVYIPIVNTCARTMYYYAINSLSMYACM